MFSGSKVAAVIIGILDAALIACIIMLFVFSNQSTSAQDTETASRTTETAEEFLAGAEDSAESSAMVSNGLIQAEYGGQVTTPTPLPTATPTPTPLPTVTLTPTAAPTTAPTDGDTSVMQDSDFIFPDSSNSVLSQEQISTLTTKEQCQRAINEIYARHGYQFHADKNATDYNYFNSLGWYQALPKVDSQDEVRASFNSVELENVNALVAYESAQGFD